MRRVAGVIAAAMLVPVAGAFAHVEIEPARAPAASGELTWAAALAREEATEPATQEPDTAPPATPAEPDTGGDGGDGDGVPIWAGIGLILLAAAAGSTLARRRNRRRVERRYTEKDGQLKD